MPDTTLVTILTGAGVAGVFCILFIMGLIFPKSVVDDLREERDFERRRADAERDRADASVAAAQATRDVLSALQAGVALGHQQSAQTRSIPVHEPRGHGERGPT